MKETIFTPFIGQYPVSKTLRFELKPVGKTLEHITREDLLQHDEKRAKDYKVAKTVMQKNSKTFKRNIVDKFKNISAKMNGIKCLWHQL